ncbi:MAG: hypothetical protein Q7V63_00240 [Gammaproteobacteria bacterium]|nr:hypothetical protein [Gammaproteobacteria bacterium]
MFRAKRVTNLAAMHNDSAKEEVEGMDLDVGLTWDLSLLNEALPKSESSSVPVKPSLTVVKPGFFSAVHSSDLYTQSSPCMGSRAKADSRVIRLPFFEAKPQIKNIAMNANGKRTRTKSSVIMAASIRPKKYTRTEGSVDLHFSIS